MLTRSVMGFCRNTLTILIPVVIAYYVFWGDKFDPESVRGKRVLVTGASSGIGEQVAYRYAELGAKLVITARRKDLLEKVATKCKELGAQSIHSVPADMTIPADRKKVVATTEKHLGGLDILILNHGIMDFAYWKSTPEDMTKLDNMMNINFHSFVDITSMLLNALKDSRGYIGVASSVIGKLGHAGWAPYCASKHALQGFYSSLRQELRFKKTGVSVTLVVYGQVETDSAVEVLNTMKTLIDYKIVAGRATDAADVLVRGVSARAYELYYPAIATFLVYFNRITPGYAEYFPTSLIMEAD